MPLEAGGEAKVELKMQLIEHQKIFWEARVRKYDRLSREYEQLLENIKKTVDQN